MNLDFGRTCELFASARCNLQCTYCYIPTDKEFGRKIQRKIFDDIKSGQFIRQLKNLFPKENLETLSHWGTEPSLTLPKFKDFYKEIIEYFPNFRQVMMSSNFMASPTLISNFIKNFPRIKPIHFDIQLSIDGPKWLTDRNRVKGSTDKILNNFYRFLNLIKDEDYFTINIHTKPTISDYGIELIAQEQYYDEYYSFFSNLITESLNIINNNKKIQISPFNNPTIVVPHNYTKENGILFNKITNIQLYGDNSKYSNQVISSPYLGRFELFREMTTSKFFYRPQMFHCSSGRESFALGTDTLHLCHRSFFEAVEGYSVNSNFTTESVNPINFNAGRMDLIKNKYTSPTENDYEVSRLQYVGRCYQDFALLKFNTAVSMIREMAYAKQISECYKDYKAAGLLAIFCTNLECLIENIVTNGSYVPNHYGLYRIFGNGVCETILSYIGDKK